MRKVFESVTELVGNTPLVRLNNIEKLLGVKARLIAKPEFMNPAGSAKDRAALQMIRDAEENGALAPGGVIIEATSGNTGIGLAAMGAALGYRVLIVMPDTMSAERIRTMEAYGAEVILTPGNLGMQGSIDKAKALKKEHPGAFIAGQFVNPSNAEAHYRTTGPEIFRDTDGQAAAFVAGIGTGGTITGTGRFLKEKIPGIRIVGVEPENSHVLSGGSAGKHDLQGIGAGFVPEVLDTSVYDEILCVSDEEAYRFGRMLSEKEGLLSGITAGAACAAAAELAKRPEFEDRDIVILLPDTGTRYLSTKLFS